MTKPRKMGALLLLSALLGGCGLGARGPLEGFEHRLSPHCTQTHPGPRTAIIGAFAQALEERGYDIRGSDVALGLVSAERLRDRPGLGAIGGWHGPGRWGPGRGVASPHDVFRGEPRSVERVSVSADGAGFTAVGSITTLSADGYVIDARPATREAFCRELHEGAAQILKEQL